MKIDQQINSPHQSGRGGHLPQLIVLHIADGSYEGTKAWFQTTGSQVSSHFIVGRDGRICQCVPLEKMAWCNGTDTNKNSLRYWGHSTVELVGRLGGNANWYSVSIECEGYYAQTKGALTEPQLKAVVGLIRHIREEVKRVYNHTIPLDRRHLVGHFEINPKTKPSCPGESFPWEQLVQLLQQDEPQDTSQEKALYGVVRQVVALSSRTAAESYAANLNKSGDGAYYYVVRRDIAG